MFILQFLFIFLIIILLFVVVFVLSVTFRMWHIIRRILGLKPKDDGFQFNSHWSFNQQGGASGYQNNARQQSPNPGQQTGPTRISGGKPRNSEIDKNEGEYVDFEVIEE